MSSNARDLMLANSIMSAAQEIYHNVMDNAAAKDDGQAYFSQLLSITPDQFDQPTLQFERADGSKELLQTNTLLAKSIKCIAGASERLRIQFSGKLKQYIDALVYKRKPRLVKRYKEELREAWIDATTDDSGRDQEQLRGAFETFAELLRIMKIRNTPEAAQQVAEMEKMFKDMQERSIGTVAAAKAFATETKDEEESQ